MLKNKKFQVPVTLSEIEKYQAAAKIYNISAAEWARRILLKAADRDISSEIKITPSEALKRLVSMNAPIDDLEIMKEQSIKGRLR